MKCWWSNRLVLAEFSGFFLVLFKILMKNLLTSLLFIEYNKKEKKLTTIDSIIIIMFHYSLHAFYVISVTVIDPITMNEILLFFFVIIMMMMTWVETDSLVFIIIHSFNYLTEDRKISIHHSINDSVSIIIIIDNDLYILFLFSFIQNFEMSSFCIILMNFEFEKNFFFCTKFYTLSIPWSKTHECSSP